MQLEVEPCDWCGRSPGVHFSQEYPTRKLCVTCAARAIYAAPWSWQELVGAIGLLAMHTGYSRICLANGIPAMKRDKWIEYPGACFITPPMYVRALQAQVAFALPPGDVAVQMRMPNPRIVH